MLGKLKTQPEDFIVSEVLTLKTQPSMQYYYYLLDKKGYSTFVAIDKINSFFNLGRDTIKYAGLKDEDGITKQHLSSDVSLPLTIIEKFNKSHEDLANGNFIRISEFGSGSESIKIGELVGNAFRVIIRQLPENLAISLYERKKHSTFFINYYGHQRFGVPHSPKNTHLIGENLLNNNYARALKLLQKQNSEYGEQAASFQGEPDDFFYSINSNILAFMQSSYYSHKWNCMIKNMVKNNSQTKHHVCNNETIEYFFLETLAEKLDLIKKDLSMKYYRISHDGQKFVSTELYRHILVQINFMVHSVIKDELHPGMWAIEGSFFLPTGCYATIAIPQMLLDFASNTNTMI